MNEGDQLLKSNSSDEGAGKKPFKRVNLNTMTNTEDLTTQRAPSAPNN